MDETQEKQLKYYIKEAVRDVYHAGAHSVGITGASKDELVLIENKRVDDGTDKIMAYLHGLGFHS